MPRKSKATRAAESSVLAPDEAAPIESSSSGGAVGVLAPEETDVTAEGDGGAMPQMVDDEADAKPQEGKDAVAEVATAERSTKPRAPEAVVEDSVRMARIECPMLRTARYVGRTLPPLSGRHGQILRDVTDGLAVEGAKLESGKEVKTPADALNWVLERLAVVPAANE